MTVQNKTTIDLIDEIVKDLKELKDKLYVEVDQITLKEEFEALDYDHQFDVTYNLLDGRSVTSNMAYMFTRLYKELEKLQTK